MAEIQLLGLFHEVGSAAEAIGQLRQLGVADQKITVMSGVPIKPELLGRHAPQPDPTLEQVLAADAWARQAAGDFLDGAARTLPR
jgi:hypothetical protein